MKDLFKIEEFAKVNGTDIHEVHCRYVNEKLNKLIESWPVVFCNKIDSYDQNTWTASEKKHPIDTHTAYLAFIEEIKKEPCKHQPIYLGRVLTNENFEIKCKHCGASLQSTWIEKKYY